jgi:valyl-tRNA synthetase
LFGAESFGQIKRLTRAASVAVRPSLEGAPRASARAVLGAGVEVAVPLEGLIDFAQERERLNREREKLQKEAAKLEAQLSNPQFAERAPAEKVNETRERLTDIAGRVQALSEMQEALV